MLDLNWGDQHILNPFGVRFFPSVSLSYLSAPPYILMNVPLCVLFVDRSHNTHNEWFFFVIHRTMVNNVVMELCYHKRWISIKQQTCSELYRSQEENHKQSKIRNIKTWQLFVAQMTVQQQKAVEEIIQEWKDMIVAAKAKAVRVIISSILPRCRYDNDRHSKPDDHILAKEVGIKFINDDQTCKYRADVIDEQTLLLQTQTQNVFIQLISDTI